MKYQFGSVGPRGRTLLAVVGVVGFLLAAHGWAHRSSGAPGSFAGGSTAAQQPGQRASAPSTHGSSGSSGSSGSAATAPSNSGAAASTPGPLLNSQSYAQYAFVIW